VKYLFNNGITIILLWAIIQFSPFFFIFTLVSTVFACMDLFTIAVPGRAKAQSQRSSHGVVGTAGESVLLITKPSAKMGIKL